LKKAGRFLAPAAYHVQAQQQGSVEVTVERGGKCQMSNVKCQMVDGVYLKSLEHLPLAFGIGHLTLLPTFGLDFDGTRGAAGPGLDRRMVKGFLVQSFGFKCSDFVILILKKRLETRNVLRVML